DKSVPSAVSGIVRVFGLVISRERLVVIVTACALIAALYVFLKFARTGQAMRAVAQDPDAAALQGVNIEAVSALGFGVGCALAGARRRSPRAGRRRRPRPHARLVLPRRRDDAADESRADPQPAARDEHGPAQHGTYLVHGRRRVRLGAPRDARGMVLLGVAGG